MKRHTRVHAPAQTQNAAAMTSVETTCRRCV